MQIEGQVFLVTGAASGLGAAVAQAFAQAGAHVVGVDLRVPSAPLAGLAAFVEADVCDAGALQGALARAGEIGPLRGAVHCAGIAPAARVVGREGPHSLDLFRKVIEVNLIGSFNLIRLAADAMSRNAPVADGERGVIVTTASVAAFDGQIGQAAYAASKAGVAGMTLPIARELARIGVRIATIAPGIMQTPMMAGMPQEVQDALGASVPYPPRLGRPDEFAALARHIVENVYLNGEVIRLDGAIRLPPK
ncbi:3-hydroxyacyl-CoA dehydrogenase [Niveibacterium umoris]|uniref:NAD(P)-dependent dehydrogenase (Short-subunit alcohol dehydrogenase family) n=1 Tax=Niveibacterium umoris TaxID=1193620 RepID=A0A840BFX6_9RHOO|nr:SDR family NAD(P)-dependent oxidoreductase [Niveibacterium umoris]MBB4011094.1 NAD(P)-dependent dehydrogenase (short-subunit alcohol dehydrogenase family) [Niveibacterium umoris]